MASVDHRLERQLCHDPMADKARSLALRFSSEFDGIVLFGATEEQINSVQRAAQCVVAIKRSDELTLNKLVAEKYPGINRKDASDGDAWLSNLQEARKRFKLGPSAVRLIDTVFGDLLRDSAMFGVHRDVTGFQVFRDGMWTLGQEKADLVITTKDMLSTLFHTWQYNKLTDQDEMGPPPDPLREDTWCEKVTKCLEKYMRLASTDPLDSNLEDKLLDPFGYVFDFTTGCIRQQKPEERLWKHTARRLRAWEPADESIGRLWMIFGRRLAKFYAAGGTSIVHEKRGGDFEVEALDLVTMYKMIIEHPDSKMTRAMAHCLVREDDDDSLETLLWLQRFDALVLASKVRIIGMLMVSGPRNCGKSWLVGSRLISFLGEHHKNYGFVVPGNFLTGLPRADAEASTPIRARFAGKKYIYFREVPALPLQPETIKPILDPSDGCLSYRANHIGNCEEISFPVTFHMAAASNSQPVIAGGDGEIGMKGKVHELRPCFQFVERPEATNERLVDNRVPTASSNGEFDAELLWASYALWASLQVLVGRQLVPIPRHIRAYERDTFGGGLEERLKKWVRKHLRGCESVDAAADVKELRALVDDHFGPLTDVQLSMVGLGRSMRIRRNRPTVKVYFKLAGLVCPGMHCDAPKSRQCVRIATQAELLLAAPEVASDSE